jgi:hypothetical protein
MGMSQSKRWVPKLRAKAVSFADPLISAVWPFEGAEGAAGADRLLLNSGNKDGNLEAHYFHAVGRSSTKHLAPKVNATAVSIADSLLTAGSPAIVEELVAGDSPIQDAVNSFDIQNDLAIHTTASPKVSSKLSSDNAVTSLASMPVFSAISNLNNTLNHNNSIVDTTQQPHQGLLRVEPQVDSNGKHAEQVCKVTVLQDETPVLSIAAAVNRHSQEVCSLPVDPQPSDTNNSQLHNFIGTITMPPEPPLIQTLPHNNLPNTTNALWVSPQQHINMPDQASTSGKRYSVRLAAKKKLMLGRSRDSISKAQDILVAKLYNSTTKNNLGSLASCSSNEVNHFEQIARLFARPLTKVQMEEIMELANHGKGKTINNKKGRKVAPFLAPVAPLASEG